MRVRLIVERLQKTSAKGDVLFSGVTFELANGEVMIVQGQSGVGHVLCTVLKGVARRRC
jgi:ABC-type transport system involved in cytochrome c biogenesis ATPase subunit